MTILASLLILAAMIVTAALAVLSAIAGVIEILPQREEETLSATLSASRSHPLQRTRPEGTRTRA